MHVIPAACAERKVPLQLRFSNNSFTPEAAEVAAQAIRRNASTLTHAYMSDIIAGRPEKARLCFPELEILGAFNAESLGGVEELSTL